MSQAISSTTKTLLAEIEPLTYRERYARIVDMGREAARGSSEARQTITELHRSADAYERLLALMSAFGSRDGALVVAGLSDVSRSVRRRASRMVALVCSDEQIEAALENIVEKRILCRTLAALSRRRRSATVDAFLEKRMKAGRDPVIIDLLPLGSEKLVSRFLPDIVEGGSFTTWERLCSRHPKFAANWFVSDIQSKNSLDPRQRYRITSAIGELARRAPDAALTIIKLLFALGEEPYQFREPLRILVRSRPVQTFDLLKARHESGRPTHPPGAFGVVFFDPVAKKIGPERLEYLVRHAYSTLRDGKHGVRWFLRLTTSDQKVVLRAFIEARRGAWGAFLFRYFKAETPEETTIRERAFDRWSRAAQGQDGTIPTTVLDWLPRDLREREARRHWDNCPALASKPERRIHYAGLFSFGEAKEKLGPWLGHPEGEQRAVAQGILISSVRHDHAALADALVNVKARKFEQDPVRKSMFDALAALRIALYSPNHLEAVGAVVDDALDAADLSQATSASVERLVVRLFRIDGFWAAKYFAKLIKVRGSVSTWGIGDGLTASDTERLSPALGQLVETWTTQERASAVISLAQSLGIRLRAADPVLSGLERLARELPFAGVAAMALGLLYKHDRRRFAKIVPELLKQDESYVLIAEVARHLSLKRQDLLSGAFLAAQPMKGRFATGRTNWVIDFQTGYARWTVTQQCTYAAGLIRLLQDESIPVPSLRFAISTLVRLAFADASVILPFASDPRQPVREMAIRGLPWLDARQGVPVLIEALGDDRARWAIYALRKVFSELRRAQVLAELRAVPTKKVTVAKEVVRLLGEMGGQDAYADLLRLDAPGTHRDVRIALLRALWDHLDKPETWKVFEKAVRDPDWIVASKLADIPLGRLSTDAEERVVALLSTILGRAEPEARIDLLKRVAFIPLRDTQRSLFKRLLEHLGTPAPEEAAHALTAALQRMNSGEVASVVNRLSELLTRGQHLLAFLPVISSKLGPYSSSMHTQIAKELLGALKKNPLLVPQYLSLGMRLWDYKELGNVLIELSKKDLLYHEAMEAALSAVRSCVHPDILEVTLRDSSDWRIRRLGLAALVSAASPQNGWSRERRERLVGYQKDKSPAVAGPAFFVFPPSEKDKAKE